MRLQVSLDKDHRISDRNGVYYINLLERKRQRQK